ncbi:MAG: RNA methyltransferase [Firmicutes bacterium]|nr:RNA methyltransferase [Bacillota bacterium]
MVIQPLDSGDNKVVRRVRHLNQSGEARKRSRETVVEGSRLVEEVLASGEKPRAVLYSPKWVEREDGRSLIIRLEALGVNLVYVSDRLMQEISQIETPPGILAVVPIPREWSLEQLLRRTAQPFVWPIALGIQDPGNLGTLMRAALAAGSPAIGIAKGTVEPFNPKCIRAAAGAAFRLPVVALSDDWVGELIASGVEVRATAVDRGRPYFELPWDCSVALVLGNEAHGLPDSMLLTGEVVTIPMSPVAESLNVAMAGAILLFHAAYQRRQAGLGFSPPAMV